MDGTAATIIKYEFHSTSFTTTAYYYVTASPDQINFKQIVTLIHMQQIISIIVATFVNFVTFFFRKIC